MHSDDSFMLKTMSFGRLLRHLRVKRMWNVGELARAAGLAKSHISLLEHGKRRPGFKAMRQLAKALQLDEQEFPVFCDAAVGQDRPYMRDRPDTGSSLNDLLGGQEGSGSVTFRDLRMPPVSAQEEAFLREARYRTSQSSPAFADGHTRSQAFPGLREEHVDKIEAL